MRSDVCAGIFVGGASSRMGGRAKGLLPGPGGVTLLERWHRLFEALEIESMLVGRRPEYAAIPLPQLEDAPAGVGPLGGLAALLAAAGERRAVVVACDMPYASQEDVEALLAAPAAPIVAPRRDGRWEPLFAVYDAPTVLPFVRRQLDEGRHSLQALLTEAGARELAMDPAHLDDWDAPGDLPGRR